MKKNNEKEQFTLFWGGPFSQWFPSEFTCAHGNFNCAEQAMMYRKAQFFYDEKSSIEIMKTNNPSEQKSIGRKVKNFKTGIWQSCAWQIVFENNFYKFTQNPELLEALFETEGTTIVEASPYDQIWGIGLDESDPRALDRSEWRGQNWLGEVVTKLRDQLLSGSLEIKKPIKKKKLF